VLACTHFPVLKKAIRKVIGASTRIVDSGETMGRALRTVAPQAHKGVAAADRVRFLAADGAERLARVGSRFLGRPVRASDIELFEL